MNRFYEDVNTSPNINLVPLPYFSLNLGDETLVAQHDASETKLEAGGPI